MIPASLLLNQSAPLAAACLVRAAQHVASVALGSTARAGAVRGVATGAATASAANPDSLGAAPDSIARASLLSAPHYLRSRGFAASAAAAAAQPDYSADEMVDKVLDCVKLQGHADSGVLSQLAECAVLRQQELTPEQIRNLTVSFARLGFYSTPFKSAMVDAVIAKLDSFDPELLADTAWAFGESLYYDYELMQHLHGYLKAHAQRFDASGLAKMLWAFGRFGWQDAMLMDLMHEIALKLQANCDSKSLAEVVYAMAQMGWADGRLHALVADYAADNLADFDPPSLAKLAFGLASVGYDDDALYSAITAAAAEALEGMSPADVSMILWACGEQGHLCHKFMSAVADSYLPANVQSFTPQQLQTAVIAWNKLGFSSPAVAQAAVRLSEVLPHLAPDFPDKGEVQA